MKLPRRAFLHLAAGAAALPAGSRIAFAQAYPSRPVRIIVGFAAGGTADITARLLGQWLSEQLGQSFLIENRTGAGSNIAAEAVAHAAPDGYTLLLASAANATNTTFAGSIAPVANIYRVPFVMEVNPSFPAKTVAEFIVNAKANPGKISYGSPGVGTISHLSGELLKIMAGVDILHVPYRGSAPALTDLIGGQVQLVFDPIPASIEYIRAGRLRPLAVTTRERSIALSDIPTLADSVPGYETSAWYGICVAKGTPTAIIEKLNRTINEALVDPKMKARLADLGGTALAGSPADFSKLIAEETEKWAKVIKFASIKPQ